MRRIMSIFFALFLLLSSIGLDAFAVNDIQIDDHIFDKDEYESLIKAIYNGDVLDGSIIYDDGIVSRKGSPTDDGLKRGYKCYWMNWDLVEEIEGGKRVRDLMSPEYIWVIPTGKNEMITCKPVGRNWEVIGYSSASQGYDLNDMIERGDLARAIELAKTEYAAASPGDNKEVLQIQCFEGHIYFTCFVLLSMGDQEWLVPFGGRPDLTGLKNGELYAPDRVAAILRKSFNLDERRQRQREAAEKGVILYGGGGSPMSAANTASAAQESARRASPYLYAVGGAVVLLGAAAVTVLYKRKKA